MVPRMIIPIFIYLMGLIMELYTWNKITLVISVSEFNRGKKPLFGEKNWLNADIMF